MPRKREDGWPNTITYPVEEIDRYIFDLIKNNRPITVKTGVEAVREALQDYYYRHGPKPNGKGGKDADLKEIKQLATQILNELRDTEKEEHEKDIDRKLWIFLTELRDRLLAGDLTDAVKDLNFWVSIMEPRGEDG